VTNHRLKSARLDRGFGMRQFAEAIGLCPVRYARIEGSSDHPERATQEEARAIVAGLLNTQSKEPNQ
jgi:transcriptional regulator with XRE-family HTH domain